uniref:AI-2E family transporter n=1 Tax=Panagrolaimus sp. JU765 TaxID=591449 RepID=A0AC34RE70_9BILA
MTEISDRRLTMDTIAGDGSREHRFAMKLAGFNMLFLLLGGIILAGAYSLYRMMDMFILAMVWAVLVGTVLFPIKYKLGKKFEDWLNHLDVTDTPFVIGLAKLPFDRFNALSDGMFEVLWSINGLYCCIFFCILKLLTYPGTLSGIFFLLGCFYGFVDGLLDFLDGTPWLFPMIVLYALVYGGWLYVQDPETIHKKFARVMSLPIWIYGIAYFASFGGPFKVFIFAGTGIVLGLISAGVIESNDEEPVPATTSEEQLEAEVPAVDEPEGKSPLSKAVAETVKDLSNQLPQLDEVTHPVSSDLHIQIIIGLVLAIYVIKHEFFMILFFLPIIFAVLKRISYKLDVIDGVHAYASRFWQSASPHASKMFTIVAAGPLRKFLKLLFTSDRFMVSTLKSKSDVLATIFVMALLALGSIFAFFFVVFEIRNETVHLVRLGSDVIANNPEWFNYAKNYTEDQLKEHNIDDYVEQAYQQGRTWLASNVRSLADPKDVARADELEEQAKILIDQLYKLWEERNIQTYNASSKALTTNGGIIEHLSHLTNLQTLQEEITTIVKDNIDTVLSIAQSLWTVIVVNLSVLRTIISTILEFVFGFGFDMLNFFIEAIVFLTMIFYLLSYSRERWLPLKWMQFLASSVGASQQVGKANITVAIENAISGVFVLSAKMAVFYGLYTYFIHSLFNLNIVFIPSLLASLFAAIPIVPAYSVLIFGAIELYFIRQEAVAAIIFVVMSIAPIGFADAAFYREVKNSHPYVTGLAIIGGMYWLGLKGAIFGPIILCSMIALVNVYAQVTSS